MATWKEATWAEVQESGRTATGESASKARPASHADRPVDAPGTSGEAPRS
ncbi:hypothetical protein KPATCC21470_8643 [Kitasatospora purpeofusca]